MRKMILPILAAIILVLTPMTAKSEIGIGLSDEGVEARAWLGPVGVGLVVDAEAGGSIDNVEVTQIDISAKLLIPLAPAAEGPGGTAQPLLWVTYGGNFTDYDSESDLDSVTDKVGTFIVGGEWRPVSKFGITAGAGIEWLVADDKEADDLFGLAGRMGFQWYLFN